MNTSLMTLIGIVSAVLIPFEKLVKVERNVKTIEYKGITYHIEVSNQQGTIHPSLIPHTHDIKQCYPVKKRKNAVLYFKLKDKSFFDNFKLLNKLDVHSHSDKDTIYYIGKNNQIYEYESKKMFSRTPSHLSHNHTITLL